MRRHDHLDVLQVLYERLSSTGMAEAGCADDAALADPAVGADILEHTVTDLGKKDFAGGMDSRTKKKSASGKIPRRAGGAELAHFRRDHAVPLVRGMKIELAAWTPRPVRKPIVAALPGTALGVRIGRDIPLSPPDHRRRQPEGQDRLPEISVALPSWRWRRTGLFGAQAWPDGGPLLRSAKLTRKEVAD